MKNTTFLSVLMVITVALSSCTDKEYTKETIRDFQQLEQPVILVSTTKSHFGNLHGNLHSVILQEKSGEFVEYSYKSTFANHIAKTFSIGDTISMHHFSTKKRTQRSKVDLLIYTIRNIALTFFIIIFLYASAIFIPRIKLYKTLSIMKTKTWQAIFFSLLFIPAVLILFYPECPAGEEYLDCEYNRAVFFQTTMIWLLVAAGIVGIIVSGAILYKDINNNKKNKNQEYPSHLILNENNVLRKQADQYKDLYNNTCFQIGDAIETIVVNLNIDLKQKENLYVFKNFTLIKNISNRLKYLSAKNNMLPEYHKIQINEIQTLIKKKTGQPLAIDWYDKNQLIKLIELLFLPDYKERIIHEFNYKNKSNLKNEHLIVEDPETRKRIQVESQDFSKDMTWQQANEACQNLSKGWRLPTISELNNMYEQLHLKGMGNFSLSRYWSSTETSSTDARDMLFYDGCHGISTKSIKTQVRCVRDY